ncbi:MAG: NAD(+)/NADH kinase [Dehalococcoidia bacterium]|nr:NAD(+)/NADH kinase [Dehalococcoidia bacterium]
MKKIGILFHPLKESAIALAADLEKFLAAQGIAVWTCSAWECEHVRGKIHGTDLILTAGGDGTILRAVNAIAPGKTPITGINLGNVGFMTEFAVEEAKDKLRHLLEGEGWIDERAVLEATVKNTSGKLLGKHYALNDVVLARGSVVRVVHIEAFIDDQPLTTYKADGVIVSTATGSTGYALAAGGPILHPRAKEIMLLPIMPHMSASYRLVLPPDTTIRLRLETVYPASLSIDGHVNLSVETGTEVTVRRSAHTVRFLRYHPPTEFYGSMEKRLKGKY